MREADDAPQPPDRPMSKQSTTSVPAEAAKNGLGGERRQQVLTAAEKCFRKHGIHATSIQQISAVAGMSPGHIYHYFRNKEAIVAGIVERMLAELLGHAERLRHRSLTEGVVEAWLARVEPALDRRADKERTSLILEIFAESTRNEAVAALVQEADVVARGKLMELFKLVPALSGLPPRELAARLTVMNAIFDGLALRMLCDPTPNRAATVRIIKRVIQGLLEEAA